MSEKGTGHCGKICVNWVCEEFPKWDDLCQGCPCNDEEDKRDEDCEDDL
jgi:hypothetical protein